MQVQQKLAAADSPFLGQAHVVTITTLLRRPLFLDTDAARAVARLQAEPALWMRSRCLAWVLMPDRWQGLVVLDRGDSMARLVHRFKSISARAMDSKFRINGWLWARHFDERALAGDEQSLTVARHLVAGPLRSGLAGTLGDYPYWNAVWLDSMDSPQA